MINIYALDLSEGGSEEMYFLCSVYNFIHICFICIQGSLE